MLGTKLQLVIAEAVAQYSNEAKDSKVSYLQLPDTDDTTVGSRCHPGYLSHKQAAKELAKYIRTLIIK